MTLGEGRGGEVVINRTNYEFEKGPSRRTSISGNDYSSWGKNHRSIFKRTYTKVGRKMVVIRNDDRYRSREGKGGTEMPGRPPTTP